MRGILFFTIYSCLLPLIAFKGPFIGILMWFWLSLMNPHMIFYGFFAGFNYALIVAVATLTFWLFSFKEPKFPPLDKTTVLLFLLMIWLSITSVSRIAAEDHVYPQWELAEKMLLMTLLAYAMTNTRERLDQLVLVCVLSVAFYGLRGGIIAIVSGGNKIFGPDGTMIGDNNDLGVALNMMLPLLFYLQQRYSQPYLKWPILGLIGLNLIAIICTYSRGAFVALCIMGVALWLRSRRKVLLAVFIILSGVGIANFAPVEWTERMSTIETYETDESAGGRLYMWQLNWYLALQYPITGGGFHWSFDVDRANSEIRGSGFPALTKARAPHSIWFQMLGDHGFVGLALFVMVLITVFANARSLIRTTQRMPHLLWANDLGRALQVALVGFAAGGSFASLALYDGFYALVIIAAAARQLVAAEIAGLPPASAAKPAASVVAWSRSPSL